MISREEFCQWILRDTGEAKKVMRAMVKATSDALATSVREVFARFDQDGDGKLDRSELWRVFKTLDGELRIPEIASLSLELDTGGDGMVSHKEFLSWLRQGSDRAQALTKTIVKETGKAREKRIHQAFTKYDSTKDDQLNIEELANALKVLGSFSSDEIRHVRDDLDKSKDGKSAVLEKKKPTRCSSQKRVASLLKLHETPGQESWRRDVDNSKLWKVFGLHTPAGRNLKKLYEAPCALPQPCSRKRHEHSWSSPFLMMSSEHSSSVSSPLRTSHGRQPPRQAW